MFHNTLTVLSSGISNIHYNLAGSSSLHARMSFTEAFAQHTPVNTLRPKQNGRHFPDDILKCIFLNWKFINFD